jgi:hypothetical protein
MYIWIRSLSGKGDTGYKLSLLYNTSPLAKQLSLSASVGGNLAYRPVVSARELLYMCIAEVTILN